MQLKVFQDTERREGERASKKKRTLTSAPAEQNVEEKEKKRNQKENRDVNAYKCRIL